jgi:hypothetical protein
MVVPGSPPSDKEKLSLLAKAFFMAATKMSKDEDDILPQAGRIDSLEQWMIFVF